MDITGTDVIYARGGNRNIGTDFPETVQHMGHGGNGGKGYGNGQVGSSSVVIIKYKSGSASLCKVGRYPKGCFICPPGLISASGSTSLSDCSLPCPAGQFSSTIPSNVARMCGIATNVACPTEMSSIGSSDTIASNGNDGIISGASFVHSADFSENAHTFRIDFERTQNIKFVKFFNRFDCCFDFIWGAEIRIGQSPTWEENEICATLNSDLNQTYNCNLAGRYIFVVVSAARAQANFSLNLMELQAFSTCTNCPATTVCSPGSVSPTACACASGSFQETRVLNLPYTRRKYSSIAQDDNTDRSLLDDVGPSWSANSSIMGEWMEMDTGEPMPIVGFISQGRSVSNALQQEYVTK